MTKMNDWIKDEENLNMIRFYADESQQLANSIMTEAHTNHVSRKYLLEKLGDLIYDVSMLKNICEDDTRE